MILEQIQEYAKRKELSTKAKKELISILQNVDFSNEKELKEIVLALYGVHPDMLSGFVLETSIENAEKIKNALDYKNANKALHVYVAAIAFSRIGQEKSASEILEQFIAENAFGKKINKQVHIGLDKALNYECAEKVILRECRDWKPRNISGFRKIWIEAAAYLKNNKFSQRVLLWFENNKIAPTQVEAGVLLSENNPITQEKIVKADDKPTAKTVENATIEELVESLSKKAIALNALFLATNKEKEDLLGQNLFIKNELLNIKQELAQKVTELKRVSEEKTELEGKYVALQKELKKTKMELIASLEEGKKTQLKLENVESAYGQAGQTEIDSIIGKIKSRLASEYEKYMEIKAKEPDLDYYDIILAMLDEIYRVLKKNGIAF